MPADMEVDADNEQLFRVIHNLCRNALQALTDPGETGMDGVKRITVSAQRVGSVVSIIVDDTGPGMPVKARENLFTAFRGSARSGGTGLGLTIARELVLAHGGTIALVEKPTPGTLFRIEIPDRPVSLDDYPLSDAGRKVMQIPQLRHLQPKSRFFSNCYCIRLKDDLEDRPRKRHGPLLPRTRSSAG